MTSGCEPKDGALEGTWTDALQDEIDRRGLQSLHDEIAERVARDKAAGAGKPRHRIERPTAGEG